MLALRNMGTVWATSVFFAFACSEEGPVVSGNFEERVVDKTIRHGQGLEVLDFDGDGDLDIVAAVSLTDAVHLYLNEPESEEQPGDRWELISVSGAGTIPAIHVVTADLDVDGDLDIAAVGSFQRDLGGNSPGELSWYENPGDVRSPWTTHAVTGASLWGARHVSAGDLDGDGAPDLITGSVDNVDGETIRGDGVYWFKNEERGSRFRGPIAIDPNLAGVVTTQLRDIDGDGRLDVLAAGRRSGLLAWYRNTLGPTGAPRFVRYTIAFGGAPFGFTFADVDADQTEELVLATTYTSSTTLRWFEPPASVDAPWVAHFIAGEIGGGGELDQSRVFAADFDDNGNIDVAVTTFAGGDLRIYQNGDNGRAWAKWDIRGGYRNLTYVTGGDIDDDGRPDLVTSTYDFGSKDRIAWWRNLPPER